MPSFDFGTPVGPWQASWSPSGLITSLGPGALGSSAVPPARVQAVVDSLCAFLAGESRPPGFSGLVDLSRSTPFQRDVYEALSAIPAGSTRSYGSIAKQLGHPSAARAVGAAAGKNPVLILIPCHRLVGADGSLTGFAGGLALKRRLLELEQSGLFEHA